MLSRNSGVLHHSELTAGLSQRNQGEQYTLMRWHSQSQLARGRHSDQERMLRFGHSDGRLYVKEYNVETLTDYFQGLYSRPWAVAFLD